MNGKQVKRIDRLVREKHHDTYKQLRKWPEPTVCITCGAIFQNGRWSWRLSAGEANKVSCPACKRVADGYPAGFLDIKGDFFGKHKNEILNLIQNEETMEKSQRPMERIIKIAKRDGGIKVTTTGIHLAQRIGKALSRAYQGDLTFQYGDSENIVRICWVR